MARGGTSKRASDAVPRARAKPSKAARKGSRQAQGHDVQSPHVLAPTDTAPAAEPAQNALPSMDAEVLWLIIQAVRTPHTSVTAASCQLAHACGQRR